MRTLSLILLATPLLAEGPIFQHQDKFVNQEFQNAYNDIRANRSSSRGLTDGASACAGCIGERISSNVDPGSRFNVAATGVWGNITSIPLTPGNWDVTGQIFWAVDGATISSTAGAVSGYSGNTITDHVVGDNATPNLTMGSTGLITLSQWRVSTSVAQVVYLKGIINFSAGTPTSFGRISATRAY